MLVCKDGDAQGTCVKHFLICSDINVSSFNMNILGHFSTALFWKELLLVCPGGLCILST